MTSYDAIVIGGGTNGLAAAGRLAKAGRKAIVVETAAEAGGGAQTREFAPGYRVSAIAHLISVLDPRVEHGLDLARHGLSYAATTIATTALSEAGDHLVLDGCYGERLEGSIGEEDREAWAALRGKLLRFADVLRPLKEMTPPKPGSTSAGELARLAKVGLKARLMGRDDMRELLRMLLINVADTLNDEIADDRLKGVVAFDAVLGAHLGPRSPNSLILLINRLAAEAAGQKAGLALPKGGMGKVALSMRAAVEAMGVEVRTNARVEQVVVEDDRAAGVVLAGGETIRGRAVISAVNPRTTFLDLVGARHLDTETVRRARNIRMRGNTAKLHLALKGEPDFKGARLTTRLVIAPSIRAVEDGFNAAKYGELSPNPAMEIVVPSAFDEGLAPKGCHVLSANVQYAPYALAQGWESGRAVFLAHIMETLEKYAPGIGHLVTSSELVTPADLEAKHGFIGGNWHHGELAVEQMLFLRPTIDASQYETPLAGLYLAGAGSHPGGGISGAAGWNAAERILARGRTA
ncbi:MAG: phytoene desaturase family protein [Hyphomicrobium sp.]|uniref:phytoene desaturase family protein n=1 Tax=Hyphomicrobium sp. TaxID=82 RepID=UPI003D0B1127